MRVTYLESPYLSVVYYAEKLCNQPGLIWLDNAKAHPELERYSY